MRTFRILLIGFVAGVAILSLLAIAAFRPPTVLVHQSIAAPGSLVALDPDADDEGSYSLRFVELDDDGYFAEREQVSRLLGDLAARMAETDITVLLYVHGWNHNAAADNDNVACFKQLARAAALMQSTFRSANGQPRGVFAVYVGWPGLVYDNRALNKALTYFGRQAAADRIGERGDLLQLFARIASLRDQHRSASAGAKFVIVAHSLGARLTYKALRPIMQNAATSGSSRGQLADVAVLVNPALSAAEHMSLSRLMSEARSVEGAPAVPRFIVATSEEDEVLTGVFPLAQRTMSFLRGDFSLGPTVRTQPIGLFADYITHRLDLSPPGAYENSEGADGCPTLDHRELGIVRGMRRAVDPRELYAYERIIHYDENGAELFHTELTPVPGGAVAPIMVVEVSGEIIPNHNDIYTSPFVEFVSRVVNAALYGTGAP